MTSLWRRGSVRPGFRAGLGGVIPIVETNADEFGWAGDARCPSNGTTYQWESLAVGRDPRSEAREALTLKERFVPVLAERRGVTPGAVGVDDAGTLRAGYAEPDESHGMGDL